MRKVESEETPVRFILRLVIFAATEPEFVSLKIATFVEAPLMTEPDIGDAESIIAETAPVPVAVVTVDDEQGAPVVGL